MVVPFLILAKAVHQFSLQGDRTHLRLNIGDSDGKILQKFAVSRRPGQGGAEMLKQQTGLNLFTRIIDCQGIHVDIPVCIGSKRAGIWSFCRDIAFLEFPEIGDTLDRADCTDILNFSQWHRTVTEHSTPGAIILVAGAENAYGRDVLNICQIPCYVFVLCHCP